MSGNGNGKSDAAAKRYPLSRAEREWLKENNDAGQDLAAQMQALQAARAEVVREILERLELKQEDVAETARLTPDFSAIVVGERRTETAQAGTAKVIDMPATKPDETPKHEPASAPV